MSVKTTFKATFIALAIFGAAGFYLFGTGSKTDTSRDKLAVASVTWIPPSRTIEVRIIVRINGAESRDQNMTISPYEESFWLRPGEVLTVNAKQRRAGQMACTIKIGGKTYTSNAQPVADATCSVSAGNDG